MARSHLCLPTLLLAAACGDATGPEPFVDPLYARMVSAGDTHTCALSGEGVAYCWGSNGSGQLGDGSTRGSLRPVAVATELRFASIHATGSPGVGAGYSCALTAEGEAYCWGSNFHGELGDGTTTQRTTPIRAGGTRRFRSLTMMLGVTCGLDGDGRAWCWGSNFYGQVGDGTTEDRASPVAVKTDSGFVALGAGGEVCGLTSRGSVLCWGARRDQEGQIHPELTPRSVASSEGFRSLSVGVSHACALTASGEAWCWGTNVYGGVGDGSTSWRASPVRVDTSLRFEALAVGAAHSCARTPEGEAYCWGYNASGALGDGGTAHRVVPVPVAGGLRFASLGAGWYHTCGVTKAEAVFCWGRNESGELGDGSGALAWTRPVPVRW